MSNQLTLKPEQIDHFLAYGHVVLRNCFSREAAEEFVGDAYQQLGYDRHDPDTWEKPLVFMYPSFKPQLRDFAPKAWNAICQLIGTEDRSANPNCSVGQWVINFWRGKDQAWVSPSPQVEGWHVDGNFFRHFLDSPEQGLLVVPLFSDVGERGGGTVLAADSVPIIARFLADHPEGVLTDEFDFAKLVSQCHDFRELTGSVGDVALVNPFLLHSFSQNHSGKPRFITNLCVSLKEPMDFDRANPANFSPVEQAVLRGLGVPSLPFHSSAPHERVPTA